jgi:hypothetical protein
MISVHDPTVRRFAAYLARRKTLKVEFSQVVKALSRRDRRVKWLRNIAQQPAADCASECLPGWGRRRPCQPVSKNVALMRSFQSHFNSHHPIERDFQETYGVLGTQIVRRKTDENPGRVHQ